MRFHNIYGFCFLLAITGILAVGAETDSIITTEIAHDDAVETAPHFRYGRAEDPGDIQCDLHDNSPSTIALRILARQLIGEFPLDNKEVSRQGSMIHKCSLVLQSKVKGDEAARIEICASYRSSALKLKIGRDMLRLANKCSVMRNGFQRTQGWVGYRNWGRFQVVPV
ncbi:hypothetical protein Q9L58_003097 [Maublancomyces gigas]|uniref:Uncharacterized protein n=1 Tax=Discina gigas TaxID=1032678 RepID=A0ABR3GPN8_9PEZI